MKGYHDSFFILGVIVQNIVQYIDDTILQEYTIFKGEWCNDSD